MSTRRHSDSIHPLFHTESLSHLHLYTKDDHEFKQHPKDNDHEIKQQYDISFIPQPSPSMKKNQTIQLHRVTSKPTVIWERETGPTTETATSITSNTGTSITTTTSTSTSSETHVTTIIRPRDAPRTPWKWTHDMDPHAYLSTQGIDGECTQILEGLYLGARSNAANKRELDRKNITCILNCCVESPNFWASDGITYHNLPILDVPDQDLTHELEKGIQWIWEQRSQGKVVLVHCVAGVSRSASIILAYLMTYHQHTLYSSFVYVKSRRACVHPNPGFLRQLSSYETKKLKHKKTTLPLVYAALCSPLTISQFEKQRRAKERKCVIM